MRPDIPPPRLERLDNATGLTVFQFDKMAPGRHFCDVVVVKASYALTADGIDPRPRPGKLAYADTHRLPDDPLRSSLAVAGDIVLAKPGADLYVTGQVTYPRPVPGWHVAVRVGRDTAPVIDYACRVTGPRRWRYRPLGWTLSDAEPTASVPVQYERAWGGYRPEADKPGNDGSWHPDNPCGSGYDFSQYRLTDEPPGPQWEAASPLVGKLNPKALVGLGPVARFWASRTRYGGTYDAAWQAQFDTGAIPDFPADFDLRFYQCAHPQLQSAEPLAGHEALTLHGLLAEAPRLDTRLPGTVIGADIGKPVQLPLDTVHIDLDARAVHLVWRLTLPHSLDIRQVSLWKEER